MWNLTSDQIRVFLLVFVRITAMISIFPVFGSGNVPIKIKVGFSILLTVLIFPAVSIEPSGVLIYSVPGFFLCVIKETFLGLIIGFSSTFLFAAAQFAGRMIDTQMGFALVQLVDPFSNAATTVTGQLQVLIYSIVFLLTNAHYFLILTIQKSFDIIPLFGMYMPSYSVGNFFVSMGADVFVLAVRLAAPVLAVLLLTSLALGIIARTVPQINIFFVGLPLKIILGLVFLAIILPNMVTVFREMVDSLVYDMWKLMYLIKG